MLIRSYSLFSAILLFIVQVSNSFEVHIEKVPKTICNYIPLALSKTIFRNYPEVYTKMVDYFNNGEINLDSKNGLIYKGSVFLGTPL